MLIAKIYSHFYRLSLFYLLFISFIIFFFIFYVFWSFIFFLLLWVWGGYCLIHMKPTKIGWFYSSTSVIFCISDSLFSIFLSYVLNCWLSGVWSLKCFIIVFNKYLNTMAAWNYPIAENARALEVKIL